MRNKSRRKHGGDAAASMRKRSNKEGKSARTRGNQKAKPVLLNGRLQGTLRGDAYLVTGDGGPDWFIPATSLFGALDGDTVRAKSVANRFGGAQEAVVTAVEVRAHEQIVGTVQTGKVLPDERRLPPLTVIYGKGEAEVPDGVKVVAKITRYGDNTHPMMGRICEVLGKADDPFVDVMSVIRRYGIRETFPAEVLEASKQAPDAVQDAELQGRHDLRCEPIFTIDGAHSKDFDDAVSAKQLNNGHIELGVHIADVSAYVPAFGALDREADRRGTSVYFADRVIPMLPEALSNGICSLNEGCDRLTLSCIMELDSEGNIVQSRLVESVIRSRHRLVYDDISALLEPDNAPNEYDKARLEALAMRYADILDSLRLLKQLQGVLQKKRGARGSIDFDVPESAFTLDAEGRAVGLCRERRGISNRIIEECMLVCNEAVAHTMREAGAPILYRVHGAPDADKLRELNTFLGTLGCRIPHASAPTPADIQSALLKSKDTPEEAIVARLLLRCMQKARYSAACEGHFGLAAAEYCHFTSPIRRYPDLFTHRVLKLWLSGALDEQKRQKLSEQAKRLAGSTSTLERAAMEAERAVDDKKRCEFMATQVGHDFVGIVSGITNHGLYVELENTAEGFVRLGAFTDDYYVAEPSAYRVTGRTHGRVIRLGDRLPITVQGVDIAASAIDFTVQNQYDKQQMYNGAKRVLPDRAPSVKGKALAKEKKKASAVLRGGSGHAARKGRKTTGTKQKS